MDIYFLLFCIGLLPSIKRSLYFLQNQFISCRSKVIRFKRNQIWQTYGKNVRFWKSAIWKFPKLSGVTCWLKFFKIWYIFEILSQNKFLKKWLGYLRFWPYFRLVINDLLINRIWVIVFNVKILWGRRSLF